jgi:hypothetical protein
VKKEKMKDIISKKTRLEFREYFVATTLREIAQEFDAADVPCDGDFTPPETGQRRSLVEQYYHAVDFGSWRDVRKVLRVFESVLLTLEERVRTPPWGGKDEWAERSLSTLKRCLERDGFFYAEGHITAVGHNPAIEQLTETAQAMDAHALREQIDRIRNSMDDDPSLAIGTAKELLETTCKTILADFGVEAAPNWDVTRLVKETRGVLRLVPEDIPDSAKGAEIIKRVLGNLGQIAQGLAELRNLYGTGHGKNGRFKGLSPRHARLAVSCSTALATFLFETHEIRQEGST